MALQAGTAYVDFVPRLVAGWEKKIEKETAGPLDRIRSGLTKSFAAVSVGVAAAGAGLVAFGAKSVAALNRVSTETAALQRLTGATAEEMSALRFAAGQVGVDTEALGQGLRQLSRVLGKDLEPNAKMLGVTLADARGKARPLHDVLLDVSEVISNLPPGIEKNAAAIKLFGRNGTALLPFLNKGRKGIAALEKEAARLGVTVGQDDVDAVRKHVAAQRLWRASIEGIQLQLGRFLLPLQARFAEALAGKVLPLLGRVATVARTTFGPSIVRAFTLAQAAMERVATFTGNVLVPRVVAAMRFLLDAVRPIGTAAGNAFERIRSVVEDRLLPVLRDTLLPIFKDRLLPVLRELASFVGDNLEPALTALGTGALVAVVSQIGGAAAGLVGIAQLLASPLAVFLAIGAAAVYAYQRIEPFRNLVDDLARVVRSAVTPAIEFFRDRLHDLVDAIGDPSDKLDTLRGLAARLGDVVRENLNPALAALSVILTALAVKAVISLGVGLAGLLAPIVALLSPVVLIVAGIAALAAGVVYAYEHFRPFRKAVDDVARSIRDKLGDAVAWVRRMWPQISEAFSHVMNVVKKVVRVGLEIVLRLWRAVGDDIKHAVQTAFRTIGEVINGLLGVVRGIIETALALINGDWGKAWDGLKHIVEGLWDALVGVVRGGFELVKTAFGAGFSLIREEWSLAWDGLKAVASAVWSGIESAARTGLRAVLDVFLGIGEEIIKAASKVFGWIPGIGDKLQDAARSFEKFRDDVNASLRGIVDPTGAIASFRQGERDFAGQNTGLFVPTLGEGGHVTGAGLAIVGERKRPELVSLPRGATVTPLDAASTLTPVTGAAGVNIEHLEVDARDTKSADGVADAINRKFGWRVSLGRL